MGVVRWIIHPCFESSRAECVGRDYREMAVVGFNANQGYAETCDPLHRGEGPP